jgi:hypothetical protein
MITWLYANTPDDGDRIGTVFVYDENDKLVAELSPENARLIATDLDALATQAVTIVRTAEIGA